MPARVPRSRHDAAIRDATLTFNQLPGATNQGVIAGYFGSGSGVRRGRLGAITTGRSDAVIGPYTSAVTEDGGGAFELGTDGPEVILVGVDDSVTSLRAGAYAAGHRWVGSLAVRLVKAGRWPVTVVP